MVTTRATTPAGCWPPAGAGLRAQLFELPLTQRPDECSQAQAPHSIWVRLEPAELVEKLAAARAYAALARELQTALDEFGSACFRVECLRAAEPQPVLEAVLPADPWYERYGAQQVQAGHYQRVITRHEHLVPLARYLQSRWPGGAAA